MIRSESVLLMPHRYNFSLISWMQYSEAEQSEVTRVKACSYVSCRNAVFAILVECYVYIFESK